MILDKLLTELFIYMFYFNFILSITLYRSNEQADQDILRSARQVRVQSSVQFRLCDATDQLFQEGIAGSLQRRARHKAHVSRQPTR